MKYSKRKDKYCCDVLNDNFHEIDDRLTDLEENGGGSGGGNSGVYVGSGEMPEDCNVQIDPSGEIEELVTKAEFDEAISEQNNKKIHKYMGYAYTNKTVTCQLSSDHVYLVVVRSLWGVGLVAIVEAGSKNTNITNITSSTYHTLALDKNTLILTLTSVGDSGYLHVTEIA